MQMLYMHFILNNSIRVEWNRVVITLFTLLGFDTQFKLLIAENLCEIKYAI